MEPNLLSQYVLAAMVAWVPPEHHFREGAARALERYRSIAADIATVALDENDAPVFGGEFGRAQTALLLASIASLESFFRKDVDEGSVLGDGGRSFCIAQIRVGSGRTQEGWSGPELATDRQKCLTAALHRVQERFRICHSKKVVDRLSGYTLGVCREDEWKSRMRVSRAMDFWSRHKFEDTTAAPPANAL